MTVNEAIEELKDLQYEGFGNCQIEHVFHIYKKTAYKAEPYILDEFLIDYKNPDIATVFTSFKQK